MTTPRDPRPAPRLRPHARPMAAVAARARRVSVAIVAASLVLGTVSGGAVRAIAPTPAPSALAGLAGDATPAAVRSPGPRPTATPSPTPTPAPVTRSRPRVSPSPVRTPAPSATPAPTPTPVHTPPSFEPPATPPADSPAPTPDPSSGASPSPSPVPSDAASTAPSATPGTDPGASPAPSDAAPASPSASPGALGPAGTGGTTPDGQVGAQLILGSITGTIFEDLNYSGGPGRAKASATGWAAAANSNGGRATVELYDGNGSLVSSTTAAWDGTYGFYLLGSGSYQVRLVTGTAPSSRTGWTNSLRPVLTYRTDASQGTVTAVADRVGGATPNLPDAAANNGWQTLANLTTANAVPQAVAPVYVGWGLLGAYDVAGIDFGISFDVVANTKDSGAGSLRQAITNANTLGGDASLAPSGRPAGKESLVFMISNGTTGSGGSLNLAAGGLRSSLNYTSGGVATIAPASGLTWITTPMVVNAQAQPGWTAAPVVELNGTNAGSTSGLYVTTNATGSTIRGLTINRFASYGILVDAATGNTTIAGCYVGTNAAGTAASANLSDGIHLSYSTGNTVGGTAAADRNVVSGNSGYGIQLNTAASTTIQGNYVGTNAAGSAAVANTSAGIDSFGTAAGIVIGGTVSGARNVVSGNGDLGISAITSGVTIQGNYVGLDATGTSAIGNATHGISVWQGDNTVIGGTTAAARNVVGGNVGAGIYVGDTSATGTLVQGNYVGTGATGTTAVPNRWGIIVDAGSTTIGGLAAGAGNLVAHNTDTGITIYGYPTQDITGVTVRGNSIHDNGAPGIDFDWDWTTANDGLKTAGTPNLHMDHPVFTTSTLSGTTLTVAGYIGIGSGQAVFAGALVDVYLSSNHVSGYGDGKTYLGTLTAGAAGTFSGTLTISAGTPAAGDAVTATATDGSGNTSEFGPNSTVKPIITLSGRVFEDVNYGGGAGRGRSATGAAAVNGATVELYTAAGAYSASTTTSSTGDYSFTVPGLTTYTVRVVTSTVVSSRSGPSSGPRGVQTYRTSMTGGVLTAVTNRVGGESPALVDAAANNGSQTLASLTTNAATAQSIASVGTGATDATLVDFGFNFDTIVNTNDSGQGSLRQFLANANALGGEGSLAQAGLTAGIETSVFVLPTTDPGYRAATTSWRITPTTALPTVTGPSMAIDGTTQAGTSLGNLWAGTPHTLTVELYLGGSLGDGLVLTGSGQTVKGLVIDHGAAANGKLVRAAGATNLVIRACYLGTNVTGTSVAGLNTAQYPLDMTSVTGLTIGGTGSSDGNVIGPNSARAITLASSTSIAIDGNFIGSNAAGSAALGSGSIGIGNHNAGESNTFTEIRHNLIVGQSLAGIHLDGTGGTQGPGPGSMTWAIAGNRIGVGRDGTTRLANGTGILAASGSTVVSGLVIGGTSAGDGNIISANTSGGITWNLAATTGLTITGNTIGYDGTGTGGSQGGDGISIGASVSGTVTIGGTASGAPNTIAGNAGKGVSLASGTTTTATIRGNRLHANGSIGIDLGADGATANDGALTVGQPNRLMDAAVLTSVTRSGNTLTVAGYVGSEAGQATFGGATVDVYESDASSSRGSGRTWVASFTANGNGGFSGTMTGSAAATFTATATDGSGRTSEFGANRTVNAAPVAVADSYAAAGDYTLTVDAPGLLANDTDADGDALTVSAPRPASGPSHGTLVLAADGSFTYTPTMGWEGTDHFTYTVTDGDLVSAAATVTITVTATAFVPSSTWPVTANPDRSFTVDFPAYVPAGSTVTGATITHRYRSQTAGDQTCYYVEVRAAGSLVRTIGSAGSPVSCNATTSYHVDLLAVPEIDTVAEANDVSVTIVAWNSGGRRSEHQLLTVTIGYSLR